MGNVLVTFACGLCHHMNSSDWEVVMVSYPQTLKDTFNPCHHVRLIEAGREKMEAHRATFDDSNLSAGIYYVVKDEGG